MALRHLLTACALAASLAFAGCGNDGSSAAGNDASASPSDTPSPSPSPSPSHSASPTASPTAGAKLPTSQLEAAAIHVAVLSSSVAKTPEQKAVVKAWMGYWQAAADTYYYAKEEPALARTSTGVARSSIIARMKAKMRYKDRIVGWARDNVTGVKITGDHATVHDCTKNFTFTIDEDGEPITRPDPWYDVTGQLAKTGGTWKVTGQKSPVLMQSCLG